MNKTCWQILQINKVNGKKTCWHQQRVKGYSKSVEVSRKGKGNEIKYTYIKF